MNCTFIVLPCHPKRFFDYLRVPACASVGRKAGNAAITHVQASNNPGERKGLAIQLSRKHKPVASTPDTTIGERRNKKIRPSFSSFEPYCHAILAL